MNILLVEDAQFKVERIQQFLIETYGPSKLTIKRSYNSALYEILNSPSYDLILLDISIPNFDTDIKDGSGEFMPLGGKHLFNQIYLNDIKSQVIVVTLYKNFDDGSLMDDLNSKFIEDYHENYLGYVLFNNLDNKWQEDLKKLIPKVK